MYVSTFSRSSNGSLSVGCEVPIGFMVCESELLDKFIPHATPNRQTYRASRDEMSGELETEASAIGVH